MGPLTELLGFKNNNDIEIFLLSISLLFFSRIFVPEMTAAVEPVHSPRFGKQNSHSLLLYKETISLDSTVRV